MNILKEDLPEVGEVIAFKTGKNGKRINLGKVVHKDADSVYMRPKGRSRFSGNSRPVTKSEMIRLVKGTTVIAFGKTAFIQSVNLETGQAVVDVSEGMRRIHMSRLFYFEEGWEVAADGMCGIVNGIDYGSGTIKVVFPPGVDDPRVKQMSFRDAMPVFFERCKEVSGSAHQTRVFASRQGISGYMNLSFTNWESRIVNLKLREGGKTTELNNVPFGEISFFYTGQTVYVPRDEYFGRVESVDGDGARVMVGICGCLRWYGMGDVIATNFGEDKRVYFFDDSGKMRSGCVDHINKDTRLANVEIDCYEETVPVAELDKIDPWVKRGSKVTIRFGKGFRTGTVGSIGTHGYDKIVDVWFGGNEPEIREYRVD